MTRAGSGNEEISARDEASGRDKASERVAIETADTTPELDMSTGKEDPGRSTRTTASESNLGPRDPDGPVPVYVASRDDFVEAWRLADLSPAYLIRVAERRMRREGVESGEAAESWLARRGVLTGYQARHLRRGAWRGLKLDDFELREQLGRGGMGHVFLAWDPLDARPVALKVLKPERQSRRDLRRFEREVELTRRLRHPRLAAARRAGRAGPYQFLAIDYVPGPTLYQWVRKVGPAPPFWACRWIADVADALDYAHQRGVIHRDLKASNMIAGAEGRATLLDLGLARWYDDDHNEASVIGRRRIVGSFNYIAPEQADDSSRATPQSDIYSLGCVLYFLLAGRAPFAHFESRREKMAAHRRLAPTPMTAYRSDLPAEFLGALDRMLLKNPMQRYSAAGEVADALRYFADRFQGAEGDDRAELEAGLEMFDTPEPTPFAVRHPTAGEADRFLARYRDPDEETPTRVGPSWSDRLRRWAKSVGARLPAFPTLPSVEEKSGSNEAGEANEANNADG